MAVLPPGTAGQATGDGAAALRLADDAHALADTLGVAAAKARALCLRGRALLQSGSSTGRGEHEQAAHYLQVAQEAARRVALGDG